MSPTDEHTLPKGERLCSKKAISRLLEKGKWGATEHLRYCAIKETSPDDAAKSNRIMVSVPKKFFRRAVKRNLLKRRIREAYRTNKHLVPSDAGINILFAYSKKEIAQYSVIEGEIKHILGRLA